MSADENKTILLVEDNPDLRAATKDLLTSIGYRVVVARNVGNALSLQRATAFDLLVVNAYPAEGSGLEIVDRIRRIIPTAPALLVSGFGDDPELRRRVLLGNVGFLSIPFSVDALQAKIEECLDQIPEPCPVPSEISVAPRRPTPERRFTRWQPWLAAAAVLVVALALQFRVASPELPAPDLGELRRSQAIAIVEPRGETMASPTRLVWRSAPEAASYRVVILEVDGTLVWRAETMTTTVALPPSVSSRLLPGVSYSWQVEGFTVDALEAGRSPLAEFRLRPGPATSRPAEPKTRRDSK